MSAGFLQLKALPALIISDDGKLGANSLRCRPKREICPSDSRPTIAGSRGLAGWLRSEGNTCANEVHLRIPPLWPRSKNQIALTAIAYLAGLPRSDPVAIFATSELCKASRYEYGDVELNNWPETF